MSFKAFKRKVDISWEDICREVYGRHSKNIRIKKEATLIRNLRAIFQAALTISNDKGFQSMTMRDLCHGSGLSMGGLYAYFSGKDELLEMLQETGRGVTRRVLAEALDGVEDPAERLRTAVSTHLYLSEVLQPWFYFSYMEAKNLSPAEKEKAVAAELETEALFALILRDGRRRGVFSACDPRLTASLIKAMVQDWYVKRWKYAKRRVSVDRYADTVIAAVEAMCRKP